MSRLLILLLLFSSSVLAETAYVTDKLRLGVHRASDTSDQAFTNIGSGEAVEVLERAGSYARVRIADGREGWVRTVFLVTEEPALTRLAKMQAERDTLAEQLAEIEARRSNSGDRLTELETEAARARQARRAAEAALSDAQAEIDALSERLAPGRVSLPYGVLFLVALLFLLAGFALSWWWFDRLSRRRHGGLRVY
jgi:SH3 domain protein